MGKHGLWCLIVAQVAMPALSAPKTDVVIFAPISPNRLGRGVAIGTDRDDEWPQGWINQYRRIDQGSLADSLG